MPELSGVAFEEWLFDPEHKTIPDFLDMPEVAFGNKLQRYDIHALRVLSQTHGAALPTWSLAGLVRLHAAGVIGRTSTDRGAVYFMTKYAHEVLKHNASFKPGVRFDGR